MKGIFVALLAIGGGLIAELLAQSWGATANESGGVYVLTIAVLLPLWVIAVTVGDTTATPRTGAS